MKSIPLENGGSALVDDADFDAVSCYVWRVAAGGYARRYERRGDGTRAAILMHRTVLGAQPGQLVDHINHDPLDNRRENLRLCTHAENMRNRKQHRHSALRFKGIRVDQSCGRHQPRYRAHLTVDGHPHRSRWFRNDLDAAHAYDALAIKYHGEFAFLNFPRAAAG